MSSREFSEWIAYYEVEPFGEDRMDINMAVIATLISTAFGDGKKEFKPQDFIINWWETPEEKKKKKMDPKLTNFIFNALSASGYGKVTKS